MEKEVEDFTVRRVPGVWGGRFYMVPQSRIPIFILARIIEDEGIWTVRSDYPHLSEEQIEASVEFIESNPEIVEEERFRHEEESRKEMERAKRYGTPLKDPDGKVFGYLLSVEDLPRIYED